MHVAAARGRIVTCQMDEGPGSIPADWSKRMVPLSDPRMPHAEAVEVCFGAFRLDLRAGLLRQDRDAIALRPKTWSVLRYLLERPGQLITKGSSSMLSGVTWRSPSPC